MLLIERLKSMPLSPILDFGASYGSWISNGYHIACVYCQITVSMLTQDKPLPAGWPIKGHPANRPFSLASPCCLHRLYFLLSGEVQYYLSSPDVFRGPPLGLSTLLA